MRALRTMSRTLLPMRMRRRQFESYLRGKKLAVVGNAPSERGRNRGAEIDTANVVVRFNNFVIAPEYSDDYGTRTDVWVTTLCNDIPFDSARAPWICCPLPLMSPALLRRYTSTNRTSLVNALLNGCVMPPRQSFECLVSEIPNPSAGLSFLHWIVAGMSQPTAFSLYGFSFFADKQGHHYFDQDRRCGHSGAQEKKYLKRLLKVSQR